MTKHIKTILTAGLAVCAVCTAFTSCADEFDRSYGVSQPALTGEYAYLNDYKPLKEYIDRSKYPNFKLGVGTTVADYLKQELVYGLVNSNFDETVAGNAMKMASCVKDDGSMDFSTVTEYVKAATDAGLSVYGHTLAWHSQQNNKYLNSLIAAKEIEVDPDAKVDKVDYEMDYSKASGYQFWAQGTTPTINSVKGALQIDNAAAVNNWEVQYQVASGMPTVTGNTYKLKVMAKATGECNLAWGIGGWSGRADGSFTIDTEWKEYEREFTATSDGGFVLFQTGKFVGTLYIKYVQITHSEAPVMEVFKDYLTNGEMESGKSMDNFVVRESGKGDKPGVPIAGGPDGKNCIVIHSVDNPANSWDTQFFIYTPDKEWAAGEQYSISFYYKASADASCETQCHGAPGSYKHWKCLPSNPNFTTKWQKYEAQGTIPSEGNGMKSIAFNLNVTKTAVDYYFADIHWGVMEKTNKIELTDEEKKDTLTWAMDRWISGMMEACEGNVKAWDVVNEALAGTDKDGDGKYDLQSATRGTVSETDAANHFYWQDYLGDVDYVRTAVRLARQYGPEDIKLFVNDYNLESDWDQNRKLTSLIQWIALWEADGVTKIDGIGTQMHISCYLNPTTQERKKAAITNMFKLMAATGKLIRVSELDMGLIDADGNNVNTADVTEEQHKMMADLYKFIVEQYLSIIPASQQWGICQWARTDSPAGSGWRANSPIGLWDINYNRKHTYAGFADGLAGK